MQATTGRPVRVDVSGNGRKPRITAVIITWNRKADVVRVVEAMSRLDYPKDRLDLVIVDNASTDGTLDALKEMWSPEYVMANDTPQAHKPNFTKPTVLGESGSNTAGLASITIVRNSDNHGGCGGFNTGFAYVASRDEKPDYMWLVDDDVDLEPDTLSQLVRVGESDKAIGLVGSRAVDINNRDFTYETTIYFDHVHGAMGPAPFEGHRLWDSHQTFREKFGGEKGAIEFTGTTDVDVVSACCMLARWEAVEHVGFWDWRFFIYCDDADWCMRMGKSGWKVVLNLDAVVYHVPWLMKSTPARSYYAQRNVLWVCHKVFETAELRRVLGVWFKAMLRDSLYAGLHRRLFHAEIIRRTPMDAIENNTGKLTQAGPKAEETYWALKGLGVIEEGGWVNIVCCQPDSLSWSRLLREHLAQRAEEDGIKLRARFREIVRNDVLGVEEGQPDGVSDRVVYGRSRKSRLKRALQVMLTRRPTATVVFDQTCDLPSTGGGSNVHIDMKDVTKAQVERDGLAAKAGFLWRWARTWLTCRAYRQGAVPFDSDERYGGLPGVKRETYQQQRAREVQA